MPHGRRDDRGPGAGMPHGRRDDRGPGAGMPHGRHDDRGPGAGMPHGRHDDRGPGAGIPRGWHGSRPRPPPPPRPLPRSRSRSRPRRPLASRLRGAVRSTLSFLFTNIGVVALVLGYIIAGAFMFQAIEGASETERAGLMAREREWTVQHLWQNVTLAINPLNETAIKDRVGGVLALYQRRVVAAVRRGWPGPWSRSRQWSFANAFLYSLTVITTIGSLLARWFKCGYALVCQCRCCAGRRVIPVPVQHTVQLEISERESAERQLRWRWHYSDSDLSARDHKEGCQPRGATLPYRTPAQTRHIDRRDLRFNHKYALDFRDPRRRRDPLDYRDPHQYRRTLSYMSPSRGVTDWYEMECSRDWDLPHPYRHSRRQGHPRLASAPPRWQPAPVSAAGSDASGAADGASSEFSYVSFDAQTITVPISVCVAILVGYVIFGSMTFGLWEQWDLLDGAYFCFISLTSIGFGDLVPGERVYTPRIEPSFVVCSLYLLLGMALVAMCFNLMQEQVIHYFAGLKRAFRRVCRCACRCCDR